MQDLLSLSNAHVLSSHLACHNSSDLDTLTRQVSSVLESPLTEMVELHLRFVNLAIKNVKYKY